MAEKIGKMWEEGEELAGRGELHEALLRFMRAKTLLAEEAKLHASPAHKNLPKK
jgi:hypothetical protein